MHNNNIIPLNERSYQPQANPMFNPNPYQATYQEVLNPSDSNYPPPHATSPTYPPPTGTYQPVYPPPNNLNHQSSTGYPLDHRPNSTLVPLIGEKEFRRSVQVKVYKPYFTYFITIVDIVMFVFQLINMFTITGSPIMTQPFNYLIGPTPEVLINQGARFVPCMKHVPGTDMPFRCPAVSNQLPSPTLPTSQICTLEQVCGISGFENNTPHQWYRIIIPIFLHGGVLHLLFNMIGQASLGSLLERKYGGFRVAIIYFAGGISGFILGANLAVTRIASVGASGAIFGLIAADLTDLLMNWSTILSPFCELFKVLFMIITSFLMGLFPVIDNFSHIGGFVGGLLASFATLPSYRSPNQKRTVTWGFLITTSVVSAGLLALWLFFCIDGFYHSNWAEACPGCKYLNCLPIYNMCDSYKEN